MLGPFSPVFRWPGQYDRSRRGKYNSEANLCAFQCHLEKASLLRAVLSGGRQQSWIISPRLGEGGLVYSSLVVLDVKQSEGLANGRAQPLRRAWAGEIRARKHNHCFSLQKSMNSLTLSALSVTRT